MVRSIKEFFDLKKNAASNEEIEELMHSNVEVNIDNVIILGSAILIASIGLNVNSIPVIIGAMLISPIMGPLFTLAYALVIRDKNILGLSLRRLLIYVVTAIIIATIYFKLSFITNPTSEIIARTNPTIFDVLIAIFGGIAGIVGITRKEKSNVIPGVAIATALMPPLCTIGYGLANWNMLYVLNAGVLFITNAYFIIVTGMIILFFMKFHKKGDIEGKSEEIIKRATIVILGIILIATLLNTSTLVTQANIEGSLDTYIYENINTDEMIVSDMSIDYRNKKITITTLETLTEKQKEGIKDYVTSQRQIDDYEIILEYESIEKL